MSSHLSSCTFLLLLLVLLVVFAPVLHGSKTSNKHVAASTVHRSKASTATEAAVPQSNHRQRNASGGSGHQNNVYYKGQNNVVTKEKLQGTLLKAQSPGQDSRRYRNDYHNNPGVKSYKKKYPTPKPRRQYYDNHEMGNSISRKPEKYYYSNDNKKHKYRHRPTESSNELSSESYLSQKTTTTLTLPKTVDPTVEPTPNQQNIDNDDIILSNLSDKIDFELSEMSNSSMNNESSNSNSSDSEKSNFNKCPTCRMREGEKQYRIERLKQTILSSLRMTAPPNTSNVAIPKLPPMAKYQFEDDMMNDSPYTKRTNQDDDFTLETERVFTKARQPPAQVELNITDSLYFAPPIKLYTSKIKTAYLWFYIRKREIRRPYIHLRIERILAESLPEKRLVTKTIFSQKLLRSRAFGWKRIDLRNVLRRWVTHPMSNHGLQIWAHDDQGNNLVVLTPYPEVDRGYEPWLDTKVVEHMSKIRRRRSLALRCTEQSTESRCCRYPLYITFGEMGWEWIIAPSRVKADYCSGECQMTMQNSSPYGWIHQQVVTTSSGTGYCCSPSKLAPLPLLYFGEDYNVYHQILQDMKVEECGCT